MNVPLFVSEARALSRLQPRAASIWGIGAVAATFVEAIYRLGARALSLLDRELAAYEWACLALSVLLFAYGEGYRALHGRFVPHVVERAVELAARPRVLLRDWLLAPFYILGLVRAERSALARAWLSIALIVVAVLLVRVMPEPWRGIVDAGVAIALSIGLGSLLRQSLQALRARSPRSYAQRSSAAAQLLDIVAREASFERRA